MGSGANSLQSHSDAHHLRQARKVSVFFFWCAFFREFFILLLRYGEFLHKVPLLSSLDKYEVDVLFCVQVFVERFLFQRMLICDTLEPIEYDDGAVILRQVRRKRRKERKKEIGKKKKRRPFWKKFFTFFSLG